MSSAPLRAHEAASRREILFLTVYFVLLIAITDIINVRLGVELMTLGVGVAAIAISRLPVLFIRDWWFFLAGLVMWNVSGPIAAYSPFPVHLHFMLALDRMIGGGHQPVVVIQHALMRSGTLGPIDYLTAIIYNLHLPEPYIIGYFLWRLNRAVYLQYAASALLLLVLGFVTFILFPAMPPWMASAWYGKLNHVVNAFGPVLKSNPLPFHGTPLFYLFAWKGDAVAAFPSEHAAFPMLDLLYFSLVRHRLQWWLAAYVLLVLVSILYLGEHWVTDALAGWFYALAIGAAVHALTTKRKLWSGTAFAPGVADHAQSQQP